MALVMILSTLIFRHHCIYEASVPLNSRVCIDCCLPWFDRKQCAWANPDAIDTIHIHFCQRLYLHLTSILGTYYNHNYHQSSCRIIPTVHRYGIQLNLTFSYVRATFVLVSRSCLQSWILPRGSWIHPREHTSKTFLENEYSSTKVLHSSGQG